MSFTSNLRQLSEAIGVSGDEGAVRKIILNAIRDHVDEIHVDALGNVLAVKKARGRARRRVRVMLDAHMDEIGFMIVGANEDGTLQFRAVGSVDDRILPGKVVLVGPDHIPGVIGLPPIHLARGSSSIKKIDSMAIDIGASGRDEAMGAVKIGQLATFNTRYRSWGTAVSGKAFDDRAGCAILIEILRGPRMPVDILAAFTVQEEVGVRGAKVAAYAFDPDAAIVLDATPANDLPPSIEWDVSPNTRLGDGPAIHMMSGNTLSDPRLVKHLMATGDQLRIPYQLRQPGGGGTDAGGIIPTRAGVPAVSVSIPARYVHAPAALIYLRDARNMVELAHESAARMTPALLRR